MGSLRGFGWCKEQSGKTRKFLADLRCSVELDELFHPPSAPLAGLASASCLVISLIARGRQRSAKDMKSPLFHGANRLLPHIPTHCDTPTCHEVPDVFFVFFRS